MTWGNITKTKAEVPTSEEKITTSAALALSSLSNGNKRHEPDKTGDSSSTNSVNCENLADRNDNTKLSLSFDPSSPVDTLRSNRENPNEYNSETDSPPFNPLTSSTSKDLFKAKKKNQDGPEDADDNKKYKSPQIEKKNKRPIASIPSMSTAVENCEESISIDDNGHGRVTMNSTGEKVEIKNKENSTSTSLLSYHDLRLKSQNAIENTPQHNYYHHPASQEPTTSSFLSPHHPYNSAYAPPSIPPQYNCYAPYYSPPYPIHFSNHQHHNSHHTGPHPHTPCNVNPHSPHFNVPHGNSYTYVHPNISQHNYEKSKPLAPQNLSQSHDQSLSNKSVPNANVISTLDADVGQNNESVALNACDEKSSHETSQLCNQIHRQAKTEKKGDILENGHKTPNAGKEVCLLYYLILLLFIHLFHLSIHTRFSALQKIDYN